LQPGIRCTIQIDPAAYGRQGTIHGTVVSPSAITQTDGTYWGYTVRIAASLKSVLEQCPYADAYDLTIGTSERGNESVDDPNFSLQQRAIHKSSGSYRHALIVFGGVAGIEECIDADESMHLSGANSSTLFDRWINICPYQGSRTIRTEEAIAIALARLSPFLHKAAQTKQRKANVSSDTIENVTLIEEEALSDESSD
jgi:predicted SPOUT superfamily RNA methylase MTH1